MKRNGFDLLAPVYDRLVSLVFGKSILHAQLEFLDLVTECNSVLVLGGGTGRFLKRLRQINPRCEIWYIDSSERMLERARRCGDAHFMKGTEQSIPDDLRADAVLTFFYLDLFDTIALGKVIDRISKSTIPGAYWIAADFADSGKWWQRLLLHVMYLFFRVVCDIQARSLPRWQDALQHAGYKPMETRVFWDGFIRAQAFRRAR